MQACYVSQFALCRLVFGGRLFATLGLTFILMGHSVHHRQVCHCMRPIRWSSSSLWRKRCEQRGKFYSTPHKYVHFDLDRFCEVYFSVYSSLSCAEHCLFIAFCCACGACLCKGIIKTFCNIICECIADAWVPVLVSAS